MNRILIAASIAALAGAASAQPANPPSPPGPGKAMMVHRDKMGWDEAKTRADVEKRIAEHFAEADANKDGAVTNDELKAAIDKRMADARAKMADAHAKMFEQLDADKSGQVSRAEWDAHHARMQANFAAGEGGPRGEKRMMVHGAGHDGAAMERMAHPGFGRWGDKWFGDADANKDGRITLSEAKAKPLAHFDNADTNKDGTLTPEERRAAHEKMRDEWRSKRGS